MSSCDQNRLRVLKPFSQKRKVRHLRNLSLRRCHAFLIQHWRGGSCNNEITVGRYVFCGLSDFDRCSTRRENFRLIARDKIRTGYTHAGRDEQFRNRAHVYSADADKMDGLYFVNIHNR